MSHKSTIELSQGAREYAEERAREEGLSSAGDYIETLIREDYEMIARQGWFRERIAEGLHSPDGREFSREYIDNLVEEGLARAGRK